MYVLQSSILHSQIKILGTSPKKFGDFLWIFEFTHYLCCVNQLNNKVMKATVESVLLNTSSRSVEIFAEILNAITSCENENELRACMKLIQERFPVSFNSCFVYGFGSTHMWVTEPGRKERLIFVEF